jgi:ArsR family transcriptional regulator
MSYFYDIKHYAMVKTEIFTSELQEMAKLSKVLSHPARLAILQYLAGTKTCISGDISDYLPLSRSTVSQHLKELKESGLIHGEIDGVRINYCLRNSAISKHKQMFDSFFTDMITLDMNCNKNL